MTTPYPPTALNEKPSLMRSADGRWIVSWPDGGVSKFLTWDAGMEAIDRWIRAQSDATGVR